MTRQEKQARKDALAKSLPSFPADYDLLFESATTGADFTNFYYYTCGEEMLLLNGGIEGRMDGGWPVGEQKENKKKGGNNSGRNRKKTKNGKFRNDANESCTVTKIVNRYDANHSVETYSSMVAIERALFDLNESSCIKSFTMRLSGYHPPPPHRRILGDLAYLEALLPDGSAVHITAFPRGFYVNRSTGSNFDPTPSDEDCYSHALLDCLLQRSKPLRVAWKVALDSAKQRSELLARIARAAENWEGIFSGIFRGVVLASSLFPNNGSGLSATGAMGTGAHMSSVPTTFVPRLDCAVLRPSWLVVLPPASGTIGDATKGGTANTWDHHALHQYDSHRPEEELLGTYGMDVRGGGLRDWNEELQTAREMPIDTFGERIERARMVHKVLSDFGDAALTGVRAILDGYILPMNPNEPARSHVYLHNNIFFSRAVDAGLDTFKIIQGDAAARKSASRDAHNIGVLHRLDVPGLHTLATLLVEYLGERLVCQSVVPGILHGEKSHTLLYGAVETLSTLRCDEEMHKLLESSLGEGCMVATSNIPAHPLTEERMELIKKHRIVPFPEQSDKKAEDGMPNKLIQVCGPIEMKGILGSDKRKYVLDCTRLTPRDANWVCRKNGGTGRWEDVANASDRKSVNVPNLIPATLEDDEWTACVLRPELVTNYVEMKIGEYLSMEAAAGKKGQSEAAGQKWVGFVRTTKEGITETESREEKAKRVALASKIEEDYIRSLRYNVNVFLPFTRSIEIMNRELHEKLKKEEEEVRNLARHLWDTVISVLTRDVRASSNTGMQLPVDGKSLTDLIHSRGINCRYLGRLAELARKEELEDVVAYEWASLSAPQPVSHETKKRAPRFRMPLCWLEQLECEMVARAAKHVLDLYLLEQGWTSASQPIAQTIALFLSAVVSVGEGGAAEKKLRRDQFNHYVHLLNKEDMNALTFFVDDGDDVSNGHAFSPRSITRGRDEIWNDIEKEIGRRYRYKLLLYNNTSSDSRNEGVGRRALYTPLLRRICQRSGIRLVAKHYDVGKKCICGGGDTAGSGLMLSHPVAPTDILDILPLVKHAASVSGESFAPSSFTGTSITPPSLHILLTDAKNAYEFGHANMNAGNSSLALEYARETSAMYNRILDTPVHPNVANTLKLMAAAHYHRNEPDQALVAAAKYLAVAISLGGFDSAEVLSAHLTMANILLGTGKIPEGGRHLRAAQFLMEFLAGENYSGISSTYYRMGSHYYEAGKLEDALRFYQAAAKRRSEDRMFDCLIARNSSGILARLGQFKSAFDYEKKAYHLYVTFLGEDHDATKACSSTLMQLMKLAVEQEKRCKIQEKERVKKYTADAVADEIRAHEEAEAETSNQQPKKKKQNKIKKGKKN